MSEAFDPYHVWLGIPPGEQPPHHYRLLALALFEASPEVIENAAERQMAHVRRAAHGKHADESQRLLGEIAAAQRALLETGRKAKYDAELRQRLSPPARAAAQTIEYTPAPPPRATAPPIAHPAAPPGKWKQSPKLAPSVVETATPLPFAVPALSMPVLAAATPLKARAKRKFPALLVVLLAVVAILPVLALVAALAMSTGEPAVASGDDTEQPADTGQPADASDQAPAPPPLPQPGESDDSTTPVTHVPDDARDPFDDSASFGRTSGKPKLEETLTISARTLLPRLAFFSLPAEARTPIEVRAGQIVKMKIDGAWRIGPGGDQVRGVDALYIAVGHPGQPATQFAQGAAQVEFNVQKDGWLFMGVEDLLNFDNAGEMNVAVSVY